MSRDEIGRPRRTIKCKWGAVLDTIQLLWRKKSPEQGRFRYGYRRFFDINTLVGLRMEDERVFADTHALIVEWLSKEKFDGVRVDHPDGLRDPKEYFERLHKASPRAWIVAEKILEPGEHLPSSWPIAGTTGRVNNLFVDADGHAPLTDLYREFSGEPTDFTAVVYDKKIGRSAKDRSSE